jgi:hypothetical protein
VFVQGKAALSVFFKFCDRLTIAPARSWREEFGARSTKHRSLKGFQLMALSYVDAPGWQGFFYERLCNSIGAVICPAFMRGSYGRWP